MNKIEILYGEYEYIKKEYLKNKSLNIKEDIKNKVIELDYEINKDYEEKLNTNFPMTTTLEKEGKRLVNLMEYVSLKKEEQKKLTEDYKKITGQTIELSYLKYSDKLEELRERLDLVNKILSIKKELTKNINDLDSVKIKVLKNKLMKKEILKLLYEFCLIDDLDVKNIDIKKIIEKEEEISKIEEKQEVVESPKKEEIKEEKNEQKEEIKQEEQEVEKQILTSVPKIDKIGTVTPVNVFESIKKTQEKIPDVVIPTNGLTEEKNDIFIDSKEYFN